MAEPDKILEEEAEVEYAPEPTEQEKEDIEKVIAPTEPALEIDTDDDIPIPEDDPKTIAAGKKREAEYKKEQKEAKKKQKTLNKETADDQSDEAFRLKNLQKMLDQKNKTLQAEMAFRDTVQANLIRNYKFAKGDLFMPEVSTKALEKKMGEEPAQQAIPDFDPKTGRMIAQMATAIVAGALGPRHASVVSAGAVGMDVAAGRAAQGLAEHDKAVQQIEAKNEALVLKYQDDIDGLFREYDKQENQNLREYARNKLRKDELDFRKGMSQVDIAKFNAAQKQNAKQANARLKVQYRKLTLQTDLNAARMAKLDREGAITLIGGPEQIKRNVKLINSTGTAKQAFQYNQSLADFYKQPGAIREITFAPANALASEFSRQINKLEGIEKQRANEMFSTLLEKGIVIPPSKITDFLTSTKAYDISTLEDAIEGKVNAPKGFNERIKLHSMKIRTPQEAAFQRSLAQSARMMFMTNIAGTVQRRLVKTVEAEKVGGETAWYNPLTWGATTTGEEIAEANR